MVITSKAMGQVSWDVLLQNIVKSRSRDTGWYDNPRIPLNVYMHLGRAAAEVPAEFQNDWKILHLNIATSGPYEILCKDFGLLSN